METKKNKVKILLIDDDEMMRILFRDIFWIHGRSDNYEIKVTDSIEEAEKIIMKADTKPDTIFLDICLSNYGKNNNFFEQTKKVSDFIKKIKANKDLLPIKIIIFSNQKEVSIEEISRQLGADGYLVKGELMPKEIIDFTDKIHEQNNKN